MTPVLLALLLSAWSLPSPAMAGASDPSVVPTNPINMFPQDWDAYEGRYAMSNGQQMVLHRRGLRMYAEITGRPRTQLVAVAANTFASVDGQLKMTLVDDGDGAMTGAVTLQGSGPQSQTTASAACRC